MTYQVILKKMGLVKTGADMEEGTLEIGMGKMGFICNFIFSN
jgi:hypothetical protein